MSHRRPILALLALRQPFFKHNSHFISEAIRFVPEAEAHTPLLACLPVLNVVYDLAAEGLTHQKVFAGLAGNVPTVLAVDINHGILFF